MKTIFSLFMFLLIAVTQLRAQVNVGEAAPDFKLSYLGGGLADRITLTEFSGKVVFIFFYGSQCDHCQINGPGTETEIHQAFNSDTNFVALGIDTWDKSATINNAFKNTTGISYPLLLNGRAASNTYYSGWAYDRVVIVGAEGKVRYKGNMNFSGNEVERVQEAISLELDKLATPSEPVETSPTTLQLNQNYPNPFNPSTTISYEIANPSLVTLKVFNVLGKEIATIVDEHQNSGPQIVTWDASSVPSGIYLYRLMVEGQVLTKRMLLIK